MFGDLPLFPEQASTSARHVDALFFFICAVTGFMGLLVTVLIVTFTIKYRRRPNQPVRTPHIEGSWRLELFWTVIPFLIMLVIYSWGAIVYVHLTHPPEGGLEVYVVGKQWMWKMQHKGGQREINTLHVPVGRAVKLTLTSEDVIHDFFVPAFRTHIDVLPGRYVTTWFEATKVGRYHLFCSQYCGTGHSAMIGEIVVMERQDYETWLGRPDGSLAVEGRKLFLKLQCLGCHSADSRARAPVLEDLYRTMVPLTDGSTTLADDTYLRESILRPRAKIVQGWQPIMPTYEGQVTEEELIALVEFIKSLGSGQTPRRNEDFPPPVGAPTTPEERKQQLERKR